MFFCCKFCCKLLQSSGTCATCAMQPAGQRYECRNAGVEGEKNEICGAGELLAQLAQLVSRANHLGPAAVGKQLSKSFGSGRYQHDPTCWSLLTRTIHEMSVSSQYRWPFLTSAGLVSMRMRVHRCLPVVGTKWSHVWVSKFDLSCIKHLQ